MRKSKKHFIDFENNQLCAFSLQIIVKSEFTTEDCKELGFIKTQLMCSSCEYLDDFGLEQLK